MVRVFQKYYAILPEYVI